MTAEHFYELLAKKLSGEAGVDQLAELNELIEKNSDWKNSAEIFSTLWQQSLPLENGGSQNLFEWHLQRMKKAGIQFEEHLSYDEIQDRPRRSLRWLWISASTIAASFAVVFVLK